MSTEQTKHDDQPSDVANPDRGAGDRAPPVGDSLEAPRRPRSAAQIAAFEKARAKRMENMKAKTKPVKAPEPEPEPEPEPAPPPAPKPKARKGRSDKGKARGYLVKHKPVREPVESSSSESDDGDEYEQQQEPVNLYSHFLIV